MTFSRQGAPPPRLPVLLSGDASHPAGWGLQGSGSQGAPPLHPNTREPRAHYRQWHQLRGDLAVRVPQRRAELACAPGGGKQPPPRPALQRGSPLCPGSLTFGGAVHGAPGRVPLALGLHPVVLAVGRVRGRVGAALLVQGQLAVRVRVVACREEGGTAQARGGASRQGEGRATWAPVDPPRVTWPPLQGVRSPVAGGPQDRQEPAGGPGPCPPPPAPRKETTLQGTRTVGLLGTPGDKGRGWLPMAAPHRPRGHAELLAPGVPGGQRVGSAPLLGAGGSMAQPPSTFWVCRAATPGSGRFLATRLPKHMSKHT